MLVLFIVVCRPRALIVRLVADFPIVKGVEELIYLFEASEFEGGYLSIIIAILYFGSVYGLEKLGGSTIFNAFVCDILADYSFVFPTLFWVGFSHIPGRLKDTDMYRVPIVGAFQPTQDRDWVIDFWNLDVKWVFVALPFGFLMMLLFYYDHVSLKSFFLPSSELTSPYRMFLPLPHKPANTPSRNPLASTGISSYLDVPASSVVLSGFLFPTVSYLKHQCIPTP